MVTVTNLLKRARKIISKPENWTQGTYARDEFGNFIREDKASCFCALGALNRAAIELMVPWTDDRFEAAEQRLSNALPRGWQSVAGYNDSPRRKHKDVLALFDRAIEAVKR